VWWLKNCFSFPATAISAIPAIVCPPHTGLNVSPASCYTFYKKEGSTMIVALHKLKSASERLIPRLLHTVPAGFPSPADDYMEDGIDLNAYLVRHPAATFMLTVSGHSMQDAGIHDGDMVIVDRSLAPKNGDIVVAVYEREMTIKRLCKNEDKSISLQAANPDYPDIHIHYGDDFEFFGVVISVIRKYR
jgi:DNA polymerase V